LSPQTEVVVLVAKDKVKRYRVQKVKERVFQMRRSSDGGAAMAMKGEEER